MDPALQQLLVQEGFSEEWIQKLMNEGYDTPNVIEVMDEEEMNELGMKRGHKSKIRLVQSQLHLQKQQQNASGPGNTSLISSLTQLLGSKPMCRFCSDSWDEANNGGAGKPAPQMDKREQRSRSDEEIQQVVQQWAQYAHVRARNFFRTDESLLYVLSQIALRVHADDDPVMGDPEECVPWFGHLTNEHECAIRMIKPGESKESITYVNRVLAFCFATDDSFEKLMALPKTPFKMRCGNQQCVNLSHICAANPDDD